MKKKFNQKKYAKEYYLKNKEKILAASKKYRIENLEIYRESQRISNKKWREANKHRYIDYHKYYKLNKKYGISREEFDKTFMHQKGKCKICKIHNDISKLVVDHCHTTKKVRGLLCFKCNRGIGIFDNKVENLTSAAKYLHESYCGKEIEESKQ